MWQYGDDDHREDATHFISTLNEIIREGSMKLDRISFSEWRIRVQLSDQVSLSESWIVANFRI